MSIEDKIFDSMDELFSEARSRGMLIYHNTMAAGEFWFTPDELEASRSRGSFRWGPVNWRLREPSVRLKQVERKLAFAQAEYDKAHSD